MKLLLLATLLATSIACSPKKEPEMSKKQVQQLNCNASIRPLTFQDNNYYYLVEGFDPKNPDCYKLVRNYIDDIKPNLTPPFTMHFLDNLPNFKPQKGRLYGNESIMKKVIAQYVYFKGSDMDVIFDPNVYGTYSEIK